MALRRLHSQQKNRKEAAVYKETYCTEYYTYYTLLLVTSMIF